ncbi:hypothetical protein OAE26_01035 [Synechococcus sp. AH-551-E05]|nr:hypothetical protein [Synechococcus sp. AH-551-E05]MDB4651149.1 hypothetical protein [Synechococcus sp. AH-551-E05]
MTESNQCLDREQAIALLVSLVAFDANSEIKWRGFYNSLTPAELLVEWRECWDSGV